MIFFNYVMSPQLTGVTIDGGFKLLASYTTNSAQAIFF